MNKSTFLSGVVTLSLLSLITYLLIWGVGSETTNEVSQAQTTHKENHTASLKRFSLPEMVNKSGSIIRGTVMEVKPGTIKAGGSDLPTVTYRMKVDESFKGTFAEKDGVKYAEITMLGNIKKGGTKGAVRKFSVLPDLPLLQKGGDYLLMLTPKSSIGLSTTVGLGQGCFAIYQDDNGVWARNEFNNSGLFNGPVKYNELATKIRRGGN